MTLGRGLALDANILIRPALGKRVHALLKAYEDSVAFYTCESGTGDQALSPDEAALRTGPHFLAGRMRRMDDDRRQTTRPNSS